MDGSSILCYSWSEGPLTFPVFLPGLVIGAIHTCLWYPTHCPVRFRSCQSHSHSTHTISPPATMSDLTAARDISGRSTHTAYFILCQLRTVVMVPYYICHIIKAENVKINLTVDGLRHCPEWSSAPSWLLLSTSRKALGAMWSSWIVEEREGVFYWLLCITNISYERVFQRSRLWQGWVCSDP